MEQYLIQDQTLQGIAEAIREKTGVTNVMFPEDMPGFIRSIAGGGSDDVPEDIAAEAQRVANGMIPKIGDNAITFLAISDMHEMGDNDWSDAAIIEKYRRANRNAGQGAKIVSDLVPLDFFVNLGDLAWGSSSTTTYDLVSSMVRARNNTCGIRDGGESFFTPGNHDVDSVAGFLAPEVVAGLTGRYRYVDFQEKKVRVICLNTADTTDGSTGTERISGEQLQWFAETLDLSTKSDAADWGIIILSHHPVDWGTTIQPVADCLAAYRNGTAYSVTHDGIAVSYDFAGKNGAGVIANFHGHVHCFKVANIDGTDALRVAIPNACFGRNNEYGAEGNTEFGETETYNKSDDSTGNNTAFCLVSVDLDRKIIYADCFGAGYDRVISYGGKEVVTYTVTNQLANAVNNNTAASVVEGSAYAATITPDSGYKLGSVTVTMGGEDITSSACAGGNISIAKVTGDIVITVTTTTSATYTVTYDLCKVSADTAVTTVSHGSTFSATLTPDSGYSVEFLRVLMGGVDVTDDVCSGSRITIPSVTGHVEIMAGYYTNLVASAQAMDSTAAYNGTGYKDGYRLSSSSPFESAASGYAMTGYIPYEVVAEQLPGTIYIKGAAWNEVSNCRLFFFNEAKTTIVGPGVQGGGSGNAALATHFTVESLGDNYLKLTPIDTGSGKWMAQQLVASVVDAKFFRISLAGSGADLVITVDEPLA